jgi:hypothetical protein
MTFVFWVIELDKGKSYQDDVSECGIGLDGCHVAHKPTLTLEYYI